MMKKLAVFLVCALLLCGCGANEAAVTDDAFIQKVMNLEEAVSAYLLDDNEGSYLIGECRGEGHLVLGTEEKEEETVVYLLTMYGEYGFTNDKFIKVSGSGVIPAVMRLEKSEDGYIGKSIEYPEDGAGYTDSIKKMFPLRYHAATLTVADTYYDELKEQEQRYAKAYLEEIGRDAEIAEYADLNTKILTDFGVPVETSNMLLGHKDLAGYPFFVGKEEKIEEGTRFVYEVSVNEETLEITYKKYLYDTPSDIIEMHIFDKSGNKIKKEQLSVSSDRDKTPEKHIFGT